MLSCDSFLVIWCVCFTWPTPRLLIKSLTIPSFRSNCHPLDGYHNKAVLASFLNRGEWNSCWSCCTYNEADSNGTLLYDGVEGAYVLFPLGIFDSFNRSKRQFSSQKKLMVCFTSNCNSWLTWGGGRRKSQANLPHPSWSGLEGCVTIFSWIHGHERKTLAG